MINIAVLMKKFELDEMLRWSKNTVQLTAYYQCLPRDPMTRWYIQGYLESTVLRLDIHNRLFAAQVPGSLVGIVKAHRCACH